MIKTYTKLKEEALDNESKLKLKKEKSHKRRVKWLSFLFNIELSSCCNFLQDQIAVSDEPVPTATLSIEGYVHHLYNTFHPTIKNDECYAEFLAYEDAFYYLYTRIKEKFESADRHYVVEYERARYIE